MKTKTVKCFQCFFYLIIINLSFYSCIENHGTYISTVTPIHIAYDELLMEWISMKTLFHYDIYEKDGRYIAVYKDSNGNSNEQEIPIEQNPAYSLNRPTGSYKYCIESWYFNIP